MTTKLRSLLERHDKLKSTKSVLENLDATAPAATTVTPAQPPISPVVEAKNWLKENAWSGSPELMTKALENLKLIAESDDEEAKKFLQFLDQCASEYEKEQAPAAAPVAEEKEDDDEEDKDKNESDDEDEEEDKDKNESDDEDDEEDEVNEEEDSEDDEEEVNEEDDSDDEDEEDKKTEKKK